jgi:phosphoglycolate phosphatase-like HAD superfamily hydrolase
VCVLFACVCLSCSLALCIVGVLLVLLLRCAFFLMLSFAAASSKRALSSTSFSMAPCSRRPVLRGVVFDMDGTLTVPNLDFAQMYARCGVPMSEDLLTAVAAMSDAKRAAATRHIEEMEAEAARTMVLARGVLECAKWINDHDIPMALVTRNTKSTVDILYERLWKPHGLRVLNPIVSRDNLDPPLPAKPDPAALQYIAQQWGVQLPSDEIIMVGDSPYNDIGFGRKAGVATALVDTGRRFLEQGSGKIDSSASEGADIVVETLAMLPQHLYKRYSIFTGPFGKESSLLHKRPTPVPSIQSCSLAAEGNYELLSGLPANELDADDEYGNSAIIYAANNGHIKVVKFLMTHEGVDLNRRGYLGNTALSRAARNGHADIVHTLITDGRLNPDIPNDKWQYPLHFAAFKKKSEVVDVLIAGGANPLSLDRKGRTPAEDTSDENIKSVLIRARNSY